MQILALFYHALAYPLGGRFKVPHGVANSLLLPHVMRFNAPNVSDRHVELAHAMGTEDVITAVKNLSKEVGTNRRMREFGVNQEDLPSMARVALQVTRLMNNNPRKMTEHDALSIYKKAW